MQVLNKHGGRLRASDAVEAVSEYIGLPNEVATHAEKVGQQIVNLFARRVRWVRQDAVRRGFVSKVERSAWILSEKGKYHLENCRPGIVIVIYETANGVALWADAQTASAVIAPDSINLIITSPPYPLIKQKAYGNKTGDEYLNCLSDIACSWRNLLVNDKSLVLNLADTWEEGSPTLSLYQERLLLRLCDELGYHFAQRFIWHNPCKPPSSEWVTVKRVRLKLTTEHIFWLSKHPNPKADNRRVLEAYTSRMQKNIAQGGERRAQRPSGHGDALVQFAKDNGGSIPGNLITAPNAVSNDIYIRQCRAAGLPIHPARFPAALPTTFIKLLTKPGDTVYDPFGGSNTVGHLCEQLGRRWITSERSLTYLEGSQFRFPPETLRVPISAFSRQHNCVDIQTNRWFPERRYGQVFMPPTRCSPGQLLPAFTWSTDYPCCRNDCLSSRRGRSALPRP
jgi:DNA modification methylase